MTGWEVAELVTVEEFQSGRRETEEREAKEAKSFAASAATEEEEALAKAGRHPDGSGPVGYTV